MKLEVQAFDTAGLKEENELIPPLITFQQFAQSMQLKKST